MSLYLVELKIKTALDLSTSIEEHLNEAPYSTEAAAAYQDNLRLGNILREIINRPKEEGNDNG